MWLDTQYRLLNEELNETLSALAGAAGLKSLVRETLGKYRGKTNAPKNRDHPWPLLPLIVCEAISGKYKRALPIAAALYLLRISAEIFDDIEDADSQESLSAKYGQAITVNVATTFLMLAEREITRLSERKVKALTTVRVIDIINSVYIDACNGQHLDLSPETKRPLTEDQYFKIIEMKSASTTRCACQTGALLASADTELINKFTAFGHNLGIASQIANDILGITQGKDVLSPKITLPVIFALNQTTATARKQLLKIYIGGDKTGYDPEKIKDLLFRSGAIQYTTIKMEYYKQQSSEVLEDIGDRLTDTEKLKMFLK